MTIKPSRNKKILIYTVLPLVLLGCILFTLQETGRIHLFKDNRSQAKQQEAKSNQVKKAAIANNPSIPTTTNPTPKGTTTSPTYTVPTSPDAIQISAQKTSTSQVTIYTKLYGYSDGTCNLHVTNGDKTVTQTASVIFQPEYSSCAGFNVPISQLGPGTWSISLDVIAGSSHQTKTIVFEVN